MRVLKDPFVQFVGIGALIFLAYSFSQSAEQADVERRIAIDAPTQDWIYSNFKKQYRRAPSRAEMGALITAFVEHEVKYREALAIGLDERDSIVRRRMMQKFDFLFGNAAADRVPDNGVLQDWYEANSMEFGFPATIGFSHLWFSPDGRGDAAESDAVAALAALRSGEQTQGDRFPFDAAFDGATRAEVRKVLGIEFADAVFEAPLGVWSGPFRSGLGYHLVRVTERAGSERLAFDEVRDSVLERWREVESERILADLVAKLKGNYAVEIDEASLVRFEYAPDGVGHAQ